MLASTQRGSLFVLRKGDEDAYPCDLCATQTLGRQRKRSASQWSLALTPGIFLWLLHEIVAQRLIERRGDGEPRNGRHRTRRATQSREQRVAGGGQAAGVAAELVGGRPWEADSWRQTAPPRLNHCVAGRKGTALSRQGWQGTSGSVVRCGSGWGSRAARTYCKYLDRADWEWRRRRRTAGTASQAAEGGREVMEQ